MRKVFNNWHFMRWLRAGIAVWAFVEAGRTGEWLLLLPGIIFALQAIFDLGCCGASGCAAPRQKNTGHLHAQSADEVIYEEVRK